MSGVSITKQGPEAQDALFVESKHKRQQEIQNTPPSLARAMSRLQFPPSYVVVGVYRLCTDKLLYQPAWDKCKHATQKGAVAGALWTFLTFGIQKEFIEVFLANSPRVTGLSNDTVFGYKLPFNVHTYAAILLLGSQFTVILRLFLSHNIRIARERAWAQTVASRGKGSDFWQPYVEEWAVPPVVEQGGITRKWEKFVSGWVGRFVIRRVLVIPFSLYPIVGILVAAWFKALSTAQHLHKPYFSSKKMTPHQVEVFMEERKWDYRAFGFAAALLEGLPIIGLMFTVSNRVGAAMWAHDLEKRQHFVAADRQRSCKGSGLSEFPSLPRSGLVKEE